MLLFWVMVWVGEGEGRVGLLFLHLLGVRLLDSQPPLSLSPEAILWLMSSLLLYFVAAFALRRLLLWLLLLLGKLFLTTLSTLSRYSLFWSAAFSASTYCFCSP